MNKCVKTKIFIINFLFPIFIGTIIYYFMFPDVIFVKYIDAITGGGLHFDLFPMDHMIGRFLRNYLLDMLWGYALVFALFYVLGNNAACLRKTFLTAISFSAAMEILQITPAVKGTFDVLDIGVELLAEVIAVLIIKKLQ